MGIDLGAVIMKHHFIFLLKVFDINSIKMDGVTKRLKRKLSKIEEDKKSAYLYRLIKGNK